MGPDTHDVSAFGISSDDLGSSKSAAAFLKVDRRRVEKSLKSTVRERTPRRMLGWRERVEPWNVVLFGNQLLLRARDSSDGSDEWIESTELPVSEKSGGGPPVWDLLESDVSIGCADQPCAA